MCALASAPAQAGLLEKLFVPKAELWERWTAHDTRGTERINHSAWDRILRTYIHPSRDGVNLVAYARVTDADKEALADYLARLQAVPISQYARAEQLAYWINLYNAVTVKLVLDRYPVDSIRDIDISPGLFSFGPWDKKLIRVEDEALSLNDIEHRILRPIWRDPRIHYAVNCASIGCPNLQRTAFTATNTEELLDKGAREYINSGRGAWLKAGDLMVSSIYVWFQDDFGGSGRGVIAHLKQYARPKLASALSALKRISGHRYDWSLNDANSM
ncbi:MAG: DUF547 domain-containing protein [Gammaproteobacteria bacterium]|nr:DUF547 domain-containing protein [Gammaproteobacteria bacterium]NIR83594.1 DUF547 domain-containing protein [Gammaproteobacteria bacterium]NIR91567.1 DUF547 domain-containing protein [Gammaproteobacteria bacterium]NIU04756.1 DUF547 domain-containing protein [Gammaproteobacteria bacterium]NIV53106.1 DUF547 domain-containing protein [Gammaproteobacteria bacterium]